MQANNPDLEMVYPKEGTNIFVDAMCIPANSKNVEAAHMFINFMLEAEVALANAEYICYASPNTLVTNNEDYSFKGNKYLYPDDDVVNNAQYFHNIDPEIRTYYEGLWEEVTLG